MVAVTYHSSLRKHVFEASKHGDAVGHGSRARHGDFSASEFQPHQHLNSDIVVTRAE